MKSNSDKSMEKTGSITSGSAMGRTGNGMGNAKSSDGVTGNGAARAPK